MSDNPTRLARRSVIGAAGALGLGLAAIGVPQSARAADHLVHDPTELSEAIAAAQPGDTITMANGVWRDVQIVFRTNGTDTAPITLRAQSPGEVIISGTSYLQLVGDHLVVDGLTFRDGAAPLNHLHLIELRGVVAGSYRSDTVD